MTARHLSTDLRFIRRARLGNNTPKVPAEIVFDDESSPLIIYRAQGNDVVIFGDVSMVGNATHASHISIDGTFSKCPSTHFQLVTCHAVCWNGYSFPFAFALLQNKSHASYENVFAEIDATATRPCHRPVFNRTDITVLCVLKRVYSKRSIPFPAL